MKKIISFALCIVFLSLLVIPCSASVIFHYNYEDFNGRAYSKNPFYIGEENQFYKISPAYSGFQISGDVDESIVTVYFTLNIDEPKRIWVGTFSQFGYSEEWSIDNTVLEDYYFSSGDMTLENFPCQLINVNFFLNANEFAINEPTSSTVSQVRFLCFDNVPSGTYRISCAINQRVVGHYYGCGVFLTDPSVPVSSSVIDDFQNGNISFDEAINTVYDNYLADISTAPDIETKQFITQSAIYYNQSLTQIQNTVSGHSIKEFHESASNIYNDFENGSTSFTGALTALQNSYETAVGGASTPEDITAINQQYFYEVAQMQDFALESTAQDMQNATHVAEDEIALFVSKIEEMNNMFDISAFEDLYQNLLWNADMFDTESGGAMRQLLDTFMVTGWLRYYILVPLVCSIIGVVLNTSILGLYFDKSTSRTRSEPKSAREYFQKRSR